MLSDAEKLSSSHTPKWPPFLLAEAPGCNEHLVLIFPVGCPDMYGVYLRKIPITVMGIYNILVTAILNFLYKVLL